MVVHGIHLRGTYFSISSVNSILWLALFSVVWVRSTHGTAHLPSQSFPGAHLYLWLCWGGRGRAYMHQVFPSSIWAITIKESFKPWMPQRRGFSSYLLWMDCCYLKMIYSHSVLANVGLTLPAPCLTGKKTCKAEIRKGHPGIFQMNLS